MGEGSENATEVTGGQGNMICGWGQSLEQGFPDCGLLSSGLFVHGLEKVNKKSKFLYALGLSIDTVSRRSSVLAEELRAQL